MHIYIKNKKLFTDYYNVKCAVGKRGIKIKKREGDLITPKGKYKVMYIFFRKDRISNLKTIIPKLSINKNMGWCNDPKSKKYNKLIRFPYKYSAEKLYRADNIYDLILVLNYNNNPVIKNKGSAIFIHLTRNYKKRKGCVAIKEKDMLILLKLINKKTKIKII